MAHWGLVIGLEFDASSEDRRLFIAAGRVIAKIQSATTRSIGFWLRHGSQKDFQVNEVDENLYTISFHTESGLMLILDNATWSLGGFLFNVKQWDYGTALADIDFFLASYWIQVHGLNLYEFTYNNAVTIGSCLGILVKQKTQS
ncbi:hypothetical protein SLEP1_g25972 [Rubroshorea leprosula]|uniref:DUF4283 domain-containing protein n=1 Tax=Rubroshorea leprosula TaxID=152421 RepID=A0AAV5JSS0_9ROSI|nr:hypothetical protein SLEP1_g25972 [Rubroshorea leprosula]